MLLGSIADDFTGATDLASMLVRSGMRTVQTIGVPRTARSLRASMRWSWRSNPAPLLRPRRFRNRLLPSNGCDRAARGRSTSSIARPSIPPTGQHRSGGRRALAGARHRLHRRVPCFSGESPHDLPWPSLRRDALLSDSPMRHHPLTPMTDRIWFACSRARLPARSGLFRIPSSRRVSIRPDYRLLVCARTASLMPCRCDRGPRLDDPRRCCADFELVTGAPVWRSDWRRTSCGRVCSNFGKTPGFCRTSGQGAVLAGSCSEATRRQVAVMAEHHPR